MTASGTNPLQRLREYGQSVWLDYIRRDLVESGGLQRLVDEDGVCGVTSNPSIFEKAFGGSADYGATLAEMSAAGDADAMTLYERLAIADVRGAADVLRRAYDATRRHDGYVSLEVSPYLAHDAVGTVAEAHRLWQTVDRPNLMIKVPATEAGLVAIEELIGAGINVNVTLLFAIARYDEVAEAYLAGLEALAQRGGDVAGVASVASFFVSRVDTVVDGLLAQRTASTNAAEAAAIAALRGKAAIANARLAYASYQQLFSGPRWEALAQRGAQTQRLLWASTSTKDPTRSDVVYVDELIGPDTVNTVPPATLDAYRDHGQPRVSLDEGLDEARGALASLERVGISLAEVTEGLLTDGVRLFAESFDALLHTVEDRRRSTLGARLNAMTPMLPDALATAVNLTLESWRKGGLSRRLWAGDATLWTGADEASWLGWLGVVAAQHAQAERFTTLAAEVRAAGYRDALLIGMGGSSLGPEVLATILGSSPGHPRLHVLDATDPAQIRRVEAQLDLQHTLCIVSSKSGTTLEPNILLEHFFSRLVAVLGPEEAGRRCIAITDPGSKLQQVAERDGFGHVCFGLPSIGGRYSVLSDFGLIPAAVQGIDVPRFLAATILMHQACAPSVPAADNPGVVLGVILGEAAKLGRDKVTLFASAAIRGLGAWLEQLLAESTGKNGRGLIPVDGEPLLAPADYSDDRVFIYLRHAESASGEEDQAVATLEQAGHPVVRISVDDVGTLGQEFFRWEMATAVAGAVIGINPFDQPDVEASKEVTRQLSAAYEATGSFPPETPLFVDDRTGIALFADEHNRTALQGAEEDQPNLVAYLRAHFARIAPGDYVALLAYLDRSPANDAELQAMRRRVLAVRRVATTVEFGPRFLHSSGQAYKGGPNTGVFLQITCDEADDLAVPGRRYSFGVVKAAQARGDLQVLADRGRRALRVHLGTDVGAGLRHLRAAVEHALA